MASVSYGLNRNAVPMNPDDIVVGSLAVSSNDVELRIDKTKSLDAIDIINILNAFIRRLEDGRLYGGDILNI